MVSVSGFYKAVKSSQNIFTEMLIDLKRDLVTMLNIKYGYDYLRIRMYLIIKCSLFKPSFGKMQNK